ncbi:MAG TPA: type II CRISPR RNA-guided endonuclease Cas9 [Alphaproteobacteria bacterium]|nr:type II CRISPR RNA-guided endonuclease Cas9 [Alphaproteobacteria bacterium]
MQKRPYRLGLDVGTNSLGWFVVWLNDDGRPTALGPGGVRIFPDGRDPKSGESNASDRRDARSARRRRDRYLRRRADLMEALIRHGLMPADRPERKALELLDPYAQRAGALDGKLPLHHFGRALFHLDQRRGFKSNRKTDSKDKSKGVIKAASSRLRSQMAESGARTLGEFLWRRHENREPVRARNRLTGAKPSDDSGFAGDTDEQDKKPKKAKVDYEFYPTRDLVEQEFDALWAAQAAYHPALTDAARDEIKDIIFYQRPLRPQPTGKCALDPATGPDDADGFRCPWAMPIAQRFRILQEVRALEIGETGGAQRRLTKEEGDRIAAELMKRRALKFDRIRALLKLGDGMRFNLESDRRTELKGDVTTHILSDAKLFGKTWRGFSSERQAEIAERLLTEPDDGAMVAWLVEHCRVESERAAAIANAPLEEKEKGHCRLGLRALRKVVPHLEAGLRYDEAARAAGYDHAKGPTDEQLDRLPYYGEWLQDAVVGTGDPRHLRERRYGRLPNPTVHIGLNQIRRVVNAIIRSSGPPAEVVIELARDLKLSDEEKSRIDREQAENQKRNEERRRILAEHGMADTALNRMKLRLWEELNPKDPLDRRCPYTGEMIGVAALLSAEIEIDHLLPFQDSLDDGAANKVVCFRHANRYKGKRTPFEAFGGSPTIDGFRYDWTAVAARANGLPKGKRWRFAPDAREQFEAKRDFLARQLNETSWLARLARQYLGAVCDPYRIWVVPGRMTEMIRGKWGLNSLLPDHNFTDAKNRADHRHHAIDALVVALTDRGLLQRIASAYDEERRRIEVPLPWESLRDDLAAALQRMVVSHKPDHGTAGRLHEETAHGLVAEPEKEDGHTLVYRKALTALTENEIARIRNAQLRQAVTDHVAAVTATGVKLADALASFASSTPNPAWKHGVRRVRLLKTEDLAYLMPVADGNGATYKAYSAGENAYVEIYELPNGRWQGEAVMVYQANRPGHVPSWRGRHPKAKLVMRLHKGDLIRIEESGRERIMVARRLDARAGRFKLADHNETGDLDKRHAKSDDPFRWLMASYNTLRSLNATRVRVDELGRPWRVAAE